MAGFDLRTETCRDRQGRRASFVFAGGLGSRFGPKHGLSKHLQPVAGSRRPVLSHALDRIPDAEADAIVGVAYRANATERYLRGAHPDVGTLRLPKVDDLVTNVHHVCRTLPHEIVTFSYGDAVLPACSINIFDELLRTRPPCPEQPLCLLLEDFPPAAGRTTFTFDGGDVRAVRSSVEGESPRLSAACAAVHLPTVLSLWDSHMHRSTGAQVMTVWPRLAERVLAEGLAVAAARTPTRTVNVNVPADLAEVARLLADEERPAPLGPVR
jgi:GTP:adenosylcobinamide-phosphate guanylyltransferase